MISKNAEAVSANALQLFEKLLQKKTQQIRNILIYIGYIFLN